MFDDVKEAERIVNELAVSKPDDWVARLRVGAVGRDLAIEELRNYLVRGLAKSLTHRYGGTVQADDVAQVSLLKILDSLDSFRSQSKFTTWAMSIATRVGISELRRQHYRDVSLDFSADGDRVRIDVEDKSAASMQGSEERNRLFALLQKLIDETLTAKQREAIRGSLAGLPIEIIAERLDSNQNAIYKLVHDARLRLRQGFEASGITAEDLLNTIA